MTQGSLFEPQPGARLGRHEEAVLRSLAERHLPSVYEAAGLAAQAGARALDDAERLHKGATTAQIMKSYVELLHMLGLAPDEHPGDPLTGDAEQPAEVERVEPAVGFAGAAQLYVVPPAAAAQ